MTKDKRYETEGLAAQLYTNAQEGSYVWWHLLDHSIKRHYRAQARVKISAYGTMCEEMDKKMMGEA